MAWSHITYNRYEDRVKRLVFEEDNEQVSVGVLKASFKGCPTFADIEVEGSTLRKMITSKYLEKESQSEGSNVNDHKISVKALLLLGILYCEGDKQSKASAFYDVIQPDLKEDIPCNDADLKALYPLVLQLATSYISYFAYTATGKRVSEEDVDKYE